MVIFLLHLNTMPYDGWRSVHDEEAWARLLGKRIESYRKLVNQHM